MSALGKAIDWWLGEMAALVPGRLSRLAGRGRTQLIVTPDGDDMHVAVRRGPKRTDLGPLGALEDTRLARIARDIRRGRLAVVLAVPEGVAVRRRAVLPLAAAENLAGVVGYEIDRLTPFAPEEIHFAHSLIARNAEQGRLEVEIAFAPKAALDPLIASLGARGLPVGRVDIIVADDTLAGLDLLATGRPPRRAGTTRVATTALAGLALMLLAAWGGSAHLSAEREIDALRNAVAEARRAAIAAEDAAAESPSVGGAALRAYQLKQGTAPAIEVVALVTEVLPDHTHLESLVYEGAEVTLSGRSADASALIGLFAAHPRFANPAFRAPITRDGADGTERFILAARVSPSDAARP